MIHFSLPPPSIIITVVTLVLIRFKPSNILLSECDISISHKFANIGIWPGGIYVASLLNQVPYYSGIV